MSIALKIILKKVAGKRKVNNIGKILFPKNNTKIMIMTPNNKN